MACPRSPRLPRWRYLRRSSPCLRRSPRPCPVTATSCSSRSGTASARSYSAAPAETMSTSRVATKPLDRYFPELHAVFLEQLPVGTVVDGEIVMPTPHGPDFGGLQMRLHPAASGVEKLARATPAAFVAFDLLAAAGKSLLAPPPR